MQHAKGTLEKLVSEQLRQAPKDEAPLLAWPLVCGKAVAEVTRAIAVEGSELLVMVPDTAWIAQLKTFASKYVAGVNALLGAKRIERIRFVIKT